MSSKDPASWTLVRKVKRNKSFTTGSKSAVAFFVGVLCVSVLAITPRAIGDPEELPDPPAEPATIAAPTIIMARKMNASAAAQADEVIVCGVFAGDPRKGPSFPIGNQIAAAGTSSCFLSGTLQPIAMVSITITAQLWLANGPANIPTGARGFGETLGRSDAAAYSAGPCLVTGNYFSSASALAVSPPGYFPVGGAVNASIPVPISCP